MVTTSNLGLAELVDIAQTAVNPLCQALGMQCTALTPQQHRNLSTEGNCNEHPYGMGVRGN
jgi:hypothetical protein